MLWIEDRRRPAHAGIQYVLQGDGAVVVQGYSEDLHGCGSLSEDCDSKPRQ